MNPKTLRTLIQRGSSLLSTCTTFDYLPEHRSLFLTFRRLQLEGHGKIERCSSSMHIHGFKRFYTLRVLARVYLGKFDSLLSPV
jgi:hypothetical protein